MGHERSQEETGVLWGWGPGSTSGLRGSLPTPSPWLPGGGNGFPAELVVQGTFAFLLTTGIERNPLTLTQKGRCALAPRPQIRKLLFQSTYPTAVQQPE